MKTKTKIINCGMYKDDKLVINTLKNHICLTIKYEDNTSHECILNEYEIGSLVEFLIDFKNRNNNSK